MWPSGLSTAGATTGIPKRTQERREHTTGRRRHSSVPTLAPPGRPPGPEQTSSVPPRDHLRRVGRAGGGSIPGGGGAAGGRPSGRGRGQTADARGSPEQVKDAGRPGLRGAQAAGLGLRGSLFACRLRSAKEREPGGRGERALSAAPLGRSAGGSVREGGGKGWWEGGVWGRGWGMRKGVRSATHAQPSAERLP